jgi:lysine-ketoglutarate reductase/saccharopine dehydrogenase-like protein (TIGR00300 family)
MRMDGVIVAGGGGPRCRLIRDVRKGDPVVCTNRTVRIRPLFRDNEGEEFGFMASGVSSERSVSVAVRRVAEELVRQKAAGGRVVVVAGPVVIHTGGGPALASLVRDGFVAGLLAGNALAVHDIESALFGTSLGIDLATGLAAREGHRNHLRAINAVYRHGSIAAAVQAGAIGSGIMYELARAGIPYVLAGSLRDDGPLPETEMDMLRAQARYAETARGASLVILLSTMLHSIAMGNMLPAWIRTICVDINPAVVTKLADRGSGQAIGIVTDVGLFLRTLADALQTAP